MEFCCIFLRHILHSILHVMNAKSFQPIKHLGKDRTRIYITLTTMDEYELSVVVKKRERKYECQKYNICENDDSLTKAFFGFVEWQREKKNNYLSTTFIIQNLGLQKQTHKNRFHFSEKHLLNKKKQLT